MRRRPFASWFALAAALSSGQITLAADVDQRLTPPNFNGANTAWMLTTSALVLMMTAPGLALAERIAGKTVSDHMAAMQQYHAAVADLL